MITTQLQSFDGFTALVSVNFDLATESFFIRSHTKLNAPQFWGDVLMPFVLFPAMKQAQELKINCTVSRKLAKNISKVQEVLNKRNTEFKLIPVSSRCNWRDFLISNKSRRRVVQFFTGGVDSFYTLLTSPQVESIIYLYDQINEPRGISFLMMGLLRNVSLEFGKDLVEITTNVRSMLDRYASWGQDSHIAVFSGIASFLSGDFSEAVIPSHYLGSATYPWADHPEINQYWESGSTALTFHGGTVSRFNKTALVARSPFALANLRVCWRATNEMNCSKCEKCLRTQVALDILGVSHQATTFEWPLDIDRLSSLNLEHEVVVFFWKENLEAARRHGRKDLVNIIESVLRDQ